LRRVIFEAAHAPPLTFKITSGLRTLAEQRELVQSGASTTMNSRHLTGHAVDVAILIGSEVDWTFANYRILADHIKATARAISLPIEWGGDWKRPVDGPHFQLPWGIYPVTT